MFAQKITRDRSTVKRCLAAIALLEMLEEEDDRVPKRGKTRHWIKRREEKGYFTNIVRELMIEDTTAYREMMRMNHESFPRSHVFDSWFALSFSICREIASAIFAE